MWFVLLLVTYVIQRRFNLVLGRQLDDWALRLQHWFKHRLPAQASEGWGLFTAAVLLPVLGLGLVSFLIQDWLFGLAYLFLQLFILFLTLGSPLQKEQFNAYLEAWRAQNYEAAYRYAREIGYVSDEPLRDETQLHWQVWRAFLEQTFARYFSVFFWFMALGAVGALATRLVNHAAHSGQTESLRAVAARVDHLVQWVPSRLLALTFALVGNFVEAVRNSLNEMIDPSGASSRVLQQAAAGALGMRGIPEQGKVEFQDKDAQSLLSLRDLLNRSVLVWFMVLAALVLAGAW